jgi:hypothetical protein
VAAQLPDRRESTNLSETLPASGSETEASKFERALPRPPTRHADQTSTNKLDPDEFVAETLKHPDRPLLPSTIPPLTDAQVDQL